MNNRSPARILVVEDHPVTRLGIVAVLQSSERFEVVGEAESAAGAIAAFERLRPDVTLLDMKLPDGTGIDVLEAIRLLEPHAKVIVLTSIDTPEQAFQALRARVNGYLMKDTAPDCLVNSVDAVAQGRSAFAEGVREAAVARQAEADLTPRELEVLRLVVAGRTNAQIATELGIGTGTARTHVSAILDKLQVSTRTEAATAAMRKGLV